MKTLEEIIAYPSEVLIPTDIANVIRVDAQEIRNLARKDPKKLGFPVIVARKSVKIPKQAFIKFMRG